MYDTEKSPMELALEAIALKDPRMVDVNEAADMAVEFHAIAVKTLQRMRAGHAQDALELEDL